MNAKKILAAGVAVLVLAGTAFQVSAAEVNSDYINTLKENGTVELILDVDAYRAAYSDLDAAFGDNTDAYIAHYLTMGMYEGRTKGILFSPLAYAEAYSDISEAFGSDITAIINHYVSFGIAENRTQGTACGYADIAAHDEAQPLRTASTGAGFYSSSAGSSSGTGSTGSNIPVQATPSDTAVARIVRHYADDNVTLIRVEYYDAADKLFQWSVVSNFVSSTNSYTEAIYYYDEAKNTIVHKRTDIYVNGVLTAH